MKKRYSFIFLSVFLISFLPLIFSCSTSDNSSAGKEAQDSTSVEDENYAQVTIKNNTSSTLFVYSDSFRDDTNLLALISKGNSWTDRDALVPESIYYFKYSVDIGIEIPWYDVDSVGIVATQKGKSIIKEVYYPSSMKTTSAYILLKNNSNNAIEFMQGNAILSPCNSDSIIINENCTGLYEIKKSVFENYPTFKAKEITAENYYNLPVAISAFVSNVVYTISYTENSLELVSEVPLDINTTKKIWSKKSYFGNSTNKFVTHVLRSRYDSNSGSILAGQLETVVENKAKVILLDECGKENLDTEIKITDSKGNPAISYLFYDLLEDSFGNFVALVKIDSANFSENKIISWSSDLKTVLWQYTFPENNLVFSINSKGKLIELSENKFAVCGMVIESEANAFIKIIEYSQKEQNVTVETWKNENSANSGCEQIFNSIIFDGNVFIACGYNNFDGDYSSSNLHSGIVYRISQDLTHSEKIYEKQKCLFYGIDKYKNGKYYICGEACDSGNALHGCLVTSDIIQSDENPILYSSKNANSWFTQICAEKNRLIFSGETSNSTDGSSGSKALVMAVNNDGKLMWQNVFENYTSVYSCMKNGIGSFLIELYNSTNNTSEIVSTDLLGNNTGNYLGIIPE